LTPQPPARSHPGQRGIWSGYRAHWQLFHPDGQITGNDGPILIRDIPNDRPLMPGETGRVLIYPIAPQFWQDIGVGASLEMREGARIIGRATVTKPLLDEPRDAEQLRHEIA
jgi:hypothetical protein